MQLLEHTDHKAPAAAPLPDELAYLSAQELATRIRRRELSPVEVVDAFIDRIEVRNPSLNALVYLGFDDARRDTACRASHSRRPSPCKRNRAQR